VIDKILELPLLLILAWLAGAALWNVAGVVLIAMTGTGFAPTASLLVVGILAAVALLLYLAARSGGIGFAVLAALCAVLAFFGVYQAYVGDPSSWATPFWRWAGAALNFYGFVAGLFGAIKGIGARRKAG
jgi:hypothetical protein